MNIVGRILRRIVGDNEAAAATSKELARLQQELRQLTRLVQDLRHSQELLPKILNGQKNDAKWRSIFRSQLSALVRAEYLSGRSGMTTEASLRARRFRLRSQNEEDGLVLALLDAAGIATRTFVEIGSGGTGGNSAVLAYDLGWTGLMIEASRRGAAVARSLFSPNPNVTVLQKVATADNINSLVRQAGMAGEIDLLSIDVDSIDYWLFDALDLKRVIRPRVIIAEYNAHFGPQRAVTLPNAPRPSDAPKSYFGASLAALTMVAGRKGYRLVLCEDEGVNAFFLRNDLATSIPGARPEQAYRPLRLRMGADQDEPRVEDAFGIARDQNLPLVEFANA